MARVYVVILCISVVIAQRSSTSSLRRKPAITELKELERQNRITQQIFANYVERRLFPHRPPKQKPPTIDDILPKTPTKTLRLIRNNSSEPNGNDSPDYDNLDTKGDPLFDDDFDDRDGDSEALQTVESNQHQYYPDGFTADPAENEVESGHSKRIRGLFTVLENIASYNAFKSKQERFRQQIEPSYQEQYDNSYTSDGNHENRFEKRDQDLYDNRSENDESDDDDSYESSRYENRQSVNSHYEASRQQNSQSSNRQHYEQQSKSPFEDRIEEIDYGGPNNETLLTELENFVYSRFHCPNCVDDSQFSNRWTMPLLKLGEKRYYLGIFFKANWFKAAQYCRFHGMHLASISSQEENDRLEKHIRDFGLGHEHFWTSGTDLADEGHFFWMANGRPITFTNWNAGEPNNFRYENGEEENCLELWNRDGKGLKWNDSPCSFETYFVCEVQ